MRQVYVHQATVTSTDGVGFGVGLGFGFGDALTAAIGPHHLAVTRDGDRAELRVLFAAAPGRVDDFRDRIDAALAAGPWELAGSGCARIGPADRDQARELLRAG